MVVVIDEHSVFIIVTRGSWLPFVARIWITVRNTCFRGFYQSVVDLHIITPTWAKEPYLFKLENRTNGAAQLRNDALKIDNLLLVYSLMSILPALVSLDG